MQAEGHPTTRLTNELAEVIGEMYLSYK